MAKVYPRLNGASKISSEWTKINEISQNAEELEQRVDTIINEPDPNKDAELVDIRTPDPSYTPERPIDVAGDMTRDMQAQFNAHKAETAADDVHGLLSGGKIIEEVGSNANGEYVRFADGTQICYNNTAVIDLTDSSPAQLVSNFPAAFVGSASQFGGLRGSIGASDVSAVQSLHIRVRSDRWEVVCDGSGATTEQGLNVGAVGRWK